MAKIRNYDGKDIEVTWDGRLCIHVGECGRADNHLFESGRDPWCNPDLTSVEEAVDVVERCPTGALTYKRGDNTSEQHDAENVAVIANNGPVYLRGELNLEGAADDMPGVKFRAALCRCGKSKNKPFCDNSHEEAGFRDHGAVGKKGDGLEAKGGELKITPYPDGPLGVEGNLTIINGSGRVAWQGKNCALCRCGESKNKPFCDGTHRKIGFKSHNEA